MCQTYESVAFYCEESIAAYGTWMKDDDSRARVTFPVYELSADCRELAGANSADIDMLLQTIAMLTSS